MANKKNLANAELNAGITSSATSFAVKAGQGARLPATPFFATITPLGVLSTPDNSEIVSVTNVSTDTLTVVRAQKSSTAYSFIAGSIISNGIYAEDITGLTQDDIADGTTNKQYSATDKTKLAGIATGADVTATQLPVATHAATGKTTPVDADETNIADSAASYGLKKLTWANIKATLKTYFDTLYQPNPQYSTSEVDTGKKWTDGSTIYRKVINTTMSVGAGINTVATGITGASSTFKFISITGGINLGSSTATTAQTFMYREAVGNWISLTSTSSTTLSFTSSFGWGTTAVIVVLEYVK